LSKTQGPERLDSEGLVLDKIGHVCMPLFIPDMQLSLKSGDAIPVLVRLRGGIIATLTLYEATEAHHCIPDADTAHLWMMATSSP